MSGQLHQFLLLYRNYTRGLSTTNQPPEPLVIDSTRFIFSRLSATNSLPLVSTLLIDPVNMGLKGTVVSCTDAETSETVSTTVTMINEDCIEGRLHQECTCIGVIWGLGGGGLRGHRPLHLL